MKTKATQNICFFTPNNQFKAVTCYDYSFAKIIDGLVDIVLVGDSLQNVIYGQKNTASVEFEKMLFHTQAVAKGISKSLIMTDLPFVSLKNQTQALAHSRILLEAGANFIKVEDNLEITKFLLKHDVPVFSHLGFTPQTISKPQKFGKITSKEYQEILEKAQIYDQLCCAGIILELVDSSLSQKITQQIQGLTIGIGSGNYCDGKIVVIYDILNLFPGKKPKFAKPIVDLKSETKLGLKRYFNENK